MFAYPASSVRRLVSLVVLSSICAHPAASVVQARADAAEAHVGTDATACLDVRRVEARGDVCPSDMMERLGPAFPFVHLQADSHRRVRLAQALPRPLPSPRVGPPQHSKIVRARIRVEWSWPRARVRGAWGAALREERSCASPFRESFFVVAVVSDVSFLSSC